MTWKTEPCLRSCGHRCITSQQKTNVLGSRKLSPSSSVQITIKLEKVSQFLGLTNGRHRLTRRIGCRASVEIEPISDEQDAKDNRDGT
jgi:hypothetical protein